MAPITVASGLNTYVLDRVTARGDVANLYGGTGGGADLVARDVLLKVARRPADNHLLEREACALATLTADGPLAELAAPYLPRYIESFACRIGSVHRRAIAMVWLPRLEPLSARPEPLDVATLRWMLRRALMALGFAHALGLTHGDVRAEHLLVHRRRRGLVLVDWTAARPVGDRLPGDDIAAAVQTLRDRAREPLPRRLRLFLRGCTPPSPRRRPQDAWALLDELDELFA